jgi:hypothetical protein
MSIFWMECIEPIRRASASVLGPSFVFVSRRAAGVWTTLSGVTCALSKRSPLMVLWTELAFAAKC